MAIQQMPQQKIPQQPQQIPINIQLDIIDILSSVFYVVRYPIEVKKEDKSSCSTCGIDKFTTQEIPPDQEWLFPLEKSLADILTPGKFQILATNVPMEILFQLGPDIAASNLQFVGGLRLGVDKADLSSENRSFPITKTIDTFESDIKDDSLLTIPFMAMIVCTDCENLYVYKGKFISNLERGNAMAEKINKQAERAMLANGMTMPKRTASGIVLPK